MVKWMKIAAGALALMAVAATASGDSNTYNYQTQGSVNFNVKSGQVVDASGNAKVVDADRDRDLVLGQNSIINSSGLSPCAAESSITFPVGNARHITLWIDAKNSAASGDVRLAVQFRMHLSSASDSNSVAVWSPNTIFGAAAARPDSVGDLIAVPTASCGAANPDEILLRWALGHFNGAASGLTSSFLAPRMKLMSFEVVPGSGTYFSVRVRNVGVGTPKIVVHYRASAL